MFLCFHFSSYRSITIKFRIKRFLQFFQKKGLLEPILLGLNQKAFSILQLSLKFFQRHKQLKTKKCYSQKSFTLDFRSDWDLHVERVEKLLIDWSRFPLAPFCFKVTCAVIIKLGFFDNLIIIIKVGLSSLKKNLPN